MSSDFVYKMLGIPKTVLSDGSYATSLSANTLTMYKKVYPGEWQLFELNYPQLVKPLIELENEQNPVPILFKLNSDL